ncbi:hypothetical protein [Ruminococcus sp.]|uniref:hypothetical protein n=1 Tax=Ruminococcus sp. TaxID=41978 RepID=UPI00386C6935
MKKNKGMAYAVLAIAFVLFNVIAFAVPTAKTSTFWIAYVFAAVAFVSQIAIWKFTFKGADTLKSKFLGIPLISVGITYLIIQLIAFAIFMAFSIAPTWIAIVVCALILGISAICLIGTETGREEINRVEEKVEKKVFYIKALQVDVEMLASTETDADTKAALTKLAEKIRFSDPMSNEVLSEIEAEITAKVKELKTAENKSAIITVLDLLITERNKKAKLLK